MADGQRDAGEAAQPQLVDHELEDRVIADRQERLRQDRRERAEARALAAGEDHGPAAAEFAVAALAHALHAASSSAATISAWSRVMCANSGKVKVRLEYSSVTGSTRAPAR